jgi:hypothetical protein
VIRRAVATAAVVVASLVGCTEDDGAPPTTTASTTTTVAPDGELEQLLVTAEDLPAGFAPSADVDDTITAFCAGQDAAAGLSASGRAIVGYTRTPAGASVIQLAFRFDDDGAARFVEQAEDLFTTCSDVPDATGLAFTYEPVSEPVEETLASVDSSASRYGVSVGSGNLTVNVAVIQQADVGILVAVLGLEEPREALDDLAAKVFAAARQRLG